MTEARTQQGPCPGESMRAWLPLLSGLLAWLLLDCPVSADDGAGPRQPSARFTITTRRKDDGVEVQSDKDRTVFTITSPFGISQAVIERVDEKWPEVVVLRLHLKGLSSFRAANGKVTLDAAVSVQEGKRQVRLWRDGKEDVPLAENDPLWTDIRILGGDGKPATELPLR